ncbi:MAG: M12 family metallopeptidase, partial [Myxococcales bacterium]|nr:M12 family metallopeptidase [Myxococcales bacterium]
GCSSHVGRIGGAQEIWVKGCGVQGSVVHEIMHAGGFYHEQSREDRDAHVTIAFDEIDPAHRQWFEVRTGSRLLGPYDYSSIMHYSRKAFSRRGQDTIIPKVPGATIGQREGLSDLDKAALAQLYGNASPPGPPTGPPTGPPSGPPPTGFSGSYTSQRGDVTCSESGGSVSCSFPGGSMVCAVQGANLDCGWLGGGLGGGQGRAVFNRQSNGTLAGTYGDFLSHDSRGAWDLVPSGQPGAPPGQPPAPPPGLNIPGLPPITLPPVPSGLPAIPGLTPPTQ